MRLLTNRLPMPLLILGLNHRTAPIAVRERFAVGVDRADPILQDLAGLPTVREAALLSTCNRTEFICHLDEADTSTLHQWADRGFAANRGALRQHGYELWGEEAAAHLIRVASGLDSLVLGEPQILGQVKSAYEQASAAGTLGRLLDRLFQQVFAASKSIRSTTAIGKNPVSVPSTAILLARQIFGELQQKTVLLIGAGEMIALCLRHLQQHGIHRLLIANRSFDKAYALAREYRGEAITLDTLPDRLSNADIVFSSTAANHFVIDKPMLKAAIKRRRHRPIFIVDIALPRDVDPGGGALDGVYLYSIDDLQQVAESNRAARQRAAGEAESAVQQSAAEFIRWWRGLSAAEHIRRIKQEAEEAGFSLTRQAVGAIQRGEDPAAVIERLTRKLTNKMLHTPTVRIREAAERGHMAMLDAAEHLFTQALDNDDNPPELGIVAKPESEEE